MAYHLERFILTYLPVGNPSTDIAPVPAKPALIQTLSGVYDSDEGEDAVDDFPHPISYGAVTSDDTVAEWRDTEDALRALVGKRGWLYRRAEDDDAIQKAVCKLLSLPGPRSVDDKAWKVSTFDWSQLSHWRGHFHHDWTLDDGEFLDEGLYLDDHMTYTYTAPLTITLNNGGNALVTDAIITITAGGVSITDVSIVKAGETDLQFTGIVAPGTALVIDCGAMSVLNNGVDAYADLELDTGHTISEWLRLAPGDNTILITLTIVNIMAPPTVNIEFMDAWK